MSSWSGSSESSISPQLLSCATCLPTSPAKATIHVTVDLSEMAFIDSTGVTVLVSGLKRLHDAGGDMALESPKASAMKVFEITGLTSVFTIRSEAASEATANGDHDVTRRHPDA